MTRLLTKAQAAVLHDIRTLPKRFRHFERIGAPVKWSVANSWDGRTLNALRQRGLIKYTEHGVQAVQEG